MESIAYILAELGENLALLLALLFIWGKVRPLVTNSGTYGDQAVLGILFGIAGCIGIRMATEIAPGVLVDHRATLAGLAGLYGGPVGALISTFLMVLYRIALGGVGVIPGAGIALTGGFLGVLLYRYLRHRSESVTYTHLLILGILVTVFAPLWAFMLPDEIGTTIYIEGLLPLLVLHPAATVLLGSLLLLDVRWQETERLRKDDAERMAQATTSAGIGIWEFDPASQETTCSPNMNELFGRGGNPFPVDFSGFLELLAPEDREKVRSWVETACAQQAVEPLMFRAQWPDGDIHWYEAAGRIIHRGPTKELRLAGVVSDVTKRQRAEELRALSEARLAEAQRISRIDSYESNCTNKSVYWSDGLFEIVGLERGAIELNEENVLQLVYEPDRAGYLETFENARHSGESYESEFRVQLPDDRVRTLQHTVNPILDPTGRCLGFRGTVQDVTERNEGEARIRESEALFRVMFEQAAVGVAQLDSQTGAFLAINRRYCEIIGYREADILGRSFREITHPDDLQEDLIRMEALFAGTSTHYTLEKRYLHQDGHIVWVNLSVSALWAAGESPDHHMAIVEDITERKQAELLLRESEARLTESQSIARIGSWDWDVVNDQAWCSKAVYTMLHFEQETLDPALSAFFEMIHPDDESRVREHVQSSLKNGAPLNFEYRHQISGYELMHVRVLGNPTLSENGEVISYHGVTQDITAVRESEQALRNRELRYRRLVESLPVCVHTIDKAGRLSSINASGLRMLGSASESGVLGKPYLDFASDAERDRIGHLLEEAWEGSSSEFEYQVSFNGRERCFQSSFVPLSGPDGAIEEVLGHTVDLTESRVREAVLRELATAIDQAAEGILITDTGRSIEYANPALLEITGFSKDELLGNSIASLYSTPENQEQLDAIWKTVMAGKTWKGECANIDRRGQHYVERATMSPVLDSTGATVKVVGLFRDVTQERVLEDQLLQSQKLKAIGTLAGGIAHDFNNILHIMLGNCRHARENKLQDPEVVMHCLDEIEYGGQRATRLIEQILTFSRASETTFQPIEVTQLLRDVVQFLRGSLPANVDISLEVPPFDFVVNGDVTQLHQLVTNLCTNAYQAIGLATGSITLGVTQQSITDSFPILSGTLTAGDFVVIQVSDTGSGIDPENLERIFDPFFTTKDVGEGTGLGLSIVHGVVHSMGGAINIHSNPGQGTTVSVYIPATKEAVTPTEPEGVERREDHSGVPFRILLVDDETAITNMLTRSLGKRGCTITTYNAPLEAIEALPKHKAEGNPFDIAICDLTMPKMNGIALSGHIAAHFPNLPILLATGMLDEAQFNDIPSELFVEVLRKPFSTRSLLATIERHVSASCHEGA